MRQRLIQFASVAAVIAIVTLAMVNVRGQTQAPTVGHGSLTKPAAKPGPPPPKTPWGDPDLQGEWAGMTPTPLERPDPGKVVVTDPAELDRLYDLDPEETGRGVGTYNAFWHETGLPIPGRDSLIVDPPNGKLPPLTPEAQKARAAARPRNPDADGGDRADGPEDRSLHERCLNWEVMITGGGNNTWYRIVQTPGWVAINQYRIHDMRLIPLDGRPHLPQDVRPWVGDSRGHWEGKTLVVDTTNYNGKNNFRGSSKNMHLVERFTRIDADTINYEATVNDPTVWTKPWTVLNPLRRDSSGFFEYACHEGNFAMVGMLSGARAKEKAKPAATKGSQ
jgi:hypothetical protein